MRRMVPLGFEPHFSAGEIVLIAVVVVGFGVLTALPATATLAAVGYRRGLRQPGWNAFWYWLWGTGVTLGSVVALLYQDLSWWSIPLSWPLPLLLAWLLKPRRQPPPAGSNDPGGELGWGHTTTGQGER